MSESATLEHEGTAPEIELPEDREYDAAENAELDAALVEAIEKAEAADNDYLATVLRNELQSLYYGSRL